MTILQKPADLNLSGNLPKFVLSSSEGVDFILKKGADTLLSAHYVPGKDSKITIDVKDIVESSLSCILKDQEQAYVQSELSATFIAEVGAQTVSFKVVKGGVDRLATSASNFLRTNFLTWQPQTKYVTYHVPEFLTFYAESDCSVKVKAHFFEGGKLSEEVKELYMAAAGSAHTVPVQYAIIAGKFGSRTPSFYDVWVEGKNGERFSYIQRYVAGSMLSEQEDWVLFENSLGGIDTFRAYGSTEMSAEHTHNIAELGEGLEEYRVDTNRSYEKSTGWLNDYQRKWLLDFFPSPQKYLYTRNFLRRIIVSEDTTSYVDNVLPTGYTFTYRFADAKPLLNLARVEDLPTDLHIEVPELGSFTIPPRLVEFPSQSLSEGVLFPVQNPYSEKWATTTIGAILQFIMNNIIATGGDGTGGVGHTHNNFSLLQGLQLINEYLTVNGQKIKAGYADKAGSVESDIYLRKDQPDETTFLLKLLGGVLIGLHEPGKKGAKIDQEGAAEFASAIIRRLLTVENIQSSRFSPGLLGAGYAIQTDEKDGTTSIEADFLTIRRKAIFANITVKELKHVGGEIIISPAAMIASKVEELTDGWKLYFQTKDGDGRTVNQEFEVGDQARCQTFNLLKQADGTVGNRYWWRLVTSVGEDFIVVSKTDADTKSDAPAVGDNISQLGNRTDKTRQNAQILSAYGTDAPSRKMYQGISSYDLTDKMVWGEFYDPVTGEMKSVAYGNSFIGDKDKSSYMSYSPKDGLKVKGKVIITGNDGSDKEITEDSLGGGTAAEAKKIAEDAKKRLDEWSKDGVVTPFEKNSLKEEINRIKSDHDNINANYEKYGMDEPAAYNTAYTTYNKQLVELTAAEPETIPIPSDFSTNMETYYTERTNALNAIEVVVKVGAENLLRNTGFTGDYQSVEMTADKVMSDDTELYSPKLEHWTGTATVKEDSDSASGYSAALGGLSQEVFLVPNEQHVLSLKAKGTDITFSANGEVQQKTLTNTYQRLELKFVSQSNNKVIFSGNCTICEIKLERGTIATDWCPHRKDRSEIADEFKKFWYLMDALGGTTSIDGGMILTSIIRLGQYQDGKLVKVNGAMSGIYNDDDDVAYCAGGDLDKAINTVKLYREDPMYQPTKEDLKNIAKVVITHGGRAILTDVIVRGGVFADFGVFKGEVHANGGVFKNIRNPNGFFSLDDDGRLHTVDADIKGILKRPWTVAKRTLIYSKVDAEGHAIDVFGYDCSPASHDKIMLQGMKAEKVYLSWGEEASGRDIMVWNDLSPLLDGVPSAQVVIKEGFAIYHDGAVYTSKDTFKLIGNTVTCMSSCNAGWIVTNIIDFNKQEQLNNK